MQIIDITDEYLPSYFVCLSDWSEEMKEAGNHKKLYYEKMKKSGLRVKLALDSENRPGGMIQYLPIENSFVEGEGLYFIQCIWVHGYKKGRGNYQGRGMGSALLRASEEDVLSLGGKGVAVWGVSLPFWMKASWYKKFGYKKADRQGIMSLLWKPLHKDASPPKWIKVKRKPKLESGKVTVTGFINGWCPATNLVFERAKQASSKFGDKVVFREINTSDPNTAREWGISDTVYINHKQVSSGPPASYKKIYRKIAKQVKKLKN
jgi:GNAT superfamily N-acetyltransferase